MKIAVLFGSAAFEKDERFLEMQRRLTEEKGFRLVRLRGNSDPKADMLMSVGGDGTYLTAAAIAAKYGIPVLGVNLGRIGFLSENEPKAVCEALLNDTYNIKELPLLSVKTEGKTFTAFNELCVLRNSESTLGIAVTVNGKALPTYWADGLLVSTPSGSTAYSLSAGGPIVLPASKVLVLSPVAPHNLNVRPMVIPQDSVIRMKFIARSDSVRVSADNTTFTINSKSQLDVSLADCTHLRVCLPESNFIKALSEKLFWGKDRRNERDR